MNPDINNDTVNASTKKEADSPSLLATLPSRLQQLRKQAKRGQRSIAEETGIAASALSAFENGQRIPSLEQTAALAKCYGVSLDELCGLSSEDDGIRKQSRADIIKAITFLCESGLPVSVIADDFDTSIPSSFVSKLNWIDTSPCHMYRGLEITLLGDWLYEFGTKYERLLHLYVGDDIDQEMLDAWKQKRIAESSDNYDLGILTEEDLDCMNAPYDYEEALETAKEIGV